MTPSCPPARGRRSRRPSWRPGGGPSARRTAAADPRGAKLLDRFAALGDRIELLAGATAWGLFPPRRLAVGVADGTRFLDAEHLVLAPGAYEYVPPFPGWTLPGVMTPGGA